MVLPARRYIRDDSFPVFLTPADIVPAFSPPNPPLPVSAGGTGDTGTAWTPYAASVSSQGGAIGAFTVNYARFKTLGKMCWAEWDITINTVGNATGVLIVSLPVTQNLPFYGIGREVVLNGNPVILFGENAGQLFVLYLTLASLFPTGNGVRFRGNATYETV